MKNLHKRSTARATVSRISLIAVFAVGAALASVGAAGANPIPPGGQPPPPSAENPAPQPGAGPQEQLPDEMRQVLSKFGQFLSHEKYGEVWKPTQVAQGWRPYEPCHWTYNREMKSWYFDDKSEWGAIVHHHGRWTLDPQQGWLWIPGTEFGPGWVAWNMRGNEVGWAPLPPEQDAGLISSASFNSDPNLWIYIQFSQLGKGCGASPLPPPQQLPRAAVPAPMPVMGAVAGGVVATGVWVGGRWFGCHARHRHDSRFHSCWRRPPPCHLRPGMAGRHCGHHHHVRPLPIFHPKRPHIGHVKPIPHFPKRPMVSGPRFNPKPIHGPRGFTPRQNFAPRHSFAPRSMGGGMRIANRGGGGMRRR